MEMGTVSKERPIDKALNDFVFNLLQSPALPRAPERGCFKCAWASLQTMMPVKEGAERNMLQRGVRLARVNDIHISAKTKAHSIYIYITNIYDAQMMTMCT